MMTDDEAKRAAWAILASAWVERDSFELFLPPSFLTLDPGDVVDVEKVKDNLFVLRGGGGNTNADVATRINGGTNNNFAFAITLTNGVVNGTGETGRTASMPTPGRPSSRPVPSSVRSRTRRR
ncbi:MAG: hypothetical protein HC774_03425 [Sphingomonadales bacterium]|nr:hypothetical protein [Sphingomonadales bacterium]